MERFLLILGIILLIFVLLSYILHRIFRKAPWVKYIPSLLLLLSVIYYIYLARQAHTGFQDIAYAILAIMLFIGFLSGLISSILFDIMGSRKKKI